MAQWLYANPAYYDLFYAEKAYAGEVKFVDRLIDSSAEPTEPSILILGCGTGRHAARFRDRGYRVVGLDKRRAMLKAARSRSDASFLQADLPTIPIEAKFDIVYLPFGVLNYLRNSAVERTIEEISRVLAPDGFLVFDLLEKVAEQTVSLQIASRDDAEYCRLTQVTPLDPDRDRYDFFVIADEDRVHTHVHVEEVYTHDENEIRSVLERYFGEITIIDGYGTNGYLDNILTVYVARNS